MSELTAALATIEKCRELSGCPAGVDLQDWVKQLAAENLAIKAMNDCLSEELRGYESDGAFEGPKMHLLWWQVETPATDRIVAGIKADGATAAGDYLKQEAQHMPVVERLMMQDAAEICYGTAARLREGGNGE